MSRPIHPSTVLLTLPRSTSAIRPLRAALTLVLLLALGIVLLPVTPTHAQVLPNTPRQSLWMTNGTVNAIQQVGNTLYIGGNFTYVGPITGGGVPLAVSDGAPCG
jgi:hypothetical protein